MGFLDRLLIRVSGHCTVRDCSRQLRSSPGTPADARRLTSFTRLRSFSSGCFDRGQQYDVAETDRGLVIARRTRSQPTMRSASPCYNRVWWPPSLSP